MEKKMMGMTGNPADEIYVHSDRVVLFYGGPFSQWAPGDFEVDGVDYNCAEQYMMAQKALLFGDHGAHAAIMASGDPAEQKAIGRRVRGFDPSRWEEICCEVVYRATRAKFLTHPGYLVVLLATGDRLIAEASATDAIWGIGLAERDPRALDPRQWQGKNWLGEALMRFRAEAADLIAAARRAAAASSSKGSN